MSLELILNAIKNSKKFTFVFILNFCLGITGIFSLEYFKGLMDKSMEGQAKTLLGADLIVTSKFPIDDETKKKINDRLPESKKVFEGVSLYSMVSSNKRGRLVQIVKVGEGFPFFGGFVFENGDRYPGERPLPSGQDVWVYPEILAQLESKKGDLLKIGDKEFKASHVVTDDSFKAIRFSGFMPRIYMTEEAIERAGLIQFGTTARYTINYLFQETFTNDELEIIEEDIEDTIGRSIHAQSPNDGSDRVVRIMQMVADFLSLVSLVTLFLSFVGLFYLYSGFLMKYKRDIMVLLDLGMRKSKVVSIYLIHFALMLLASGAVVAIIINFLAPWAKEIIATNLSLDLVFKVDHLFYAKAALFLLLITPAVALPMLLQTIEGKFKPNAKSLLPYLPLLALFLGLSAYVSESEKTGLFFCLGVFATAIVAMAAGYFFLQSQDSVGLKGKVWRSLAAKNIIRRKASSLVIAISLFLCSALFSLIPQISHSLTESLELAKDEKPQFFLFDIQEEQLKALHSFIQDTGASLDSPSPMIGARVISVNGEDFLAEDFDEEDGEAADDERGEMRNRSVNLSYRKALYPTEEIVEGKPFSGPYTDDDFSKPVEISVEKRYADRRELEVGDALVFDVLGMEIPAEIVNIRTVKWTDFVPNFFFLLQSGSLNDAPKTFLATVSNSKVDPNELTLQLAKKFPNISVVDVKDVIDKILGIVQMVNGVLRQMGVFSIIIGLLMIFIIIQHQMTLRRPDIMRLKMIGVKLGQIRKSIVLEFALVSLTSTLLGLSVGVASSWALANYVFEGRWSFQWELLLLIGISIPLLIVTVTAVFSWFATSRSEMDLFGELGDD